MTGPVGFVPPWIGWSFDRCAYHGCVEPRAVHVTELHGERVEVGRRWCDYHCAARDAQIAQGNQALHGPETRDDLDDEDGVVVTWDPSPRTA